ncbi:MAG: hypothetical protein ABL908_19365, partial [Hyphomicrobium sp.]
MSTATATPFCDLAARAVVAAGKFRSLYGAVETRADEEAIEPELRRLDREMSEAVAMATSTPASDRASLTAKAQLFEAISDRGMMFDHQALARTLARDIIALGEVSSAGMRRASRAIADGPQRAAAREAVLALTRVDVRTRLYSRAGAMGETVLLSLVDPARAREFARARGIPPSLAARPALRAVSPCRNWACIRPPRHGNVAV